MGRCARFALTAQILSTFLYTLIFAKVTPILQPGFFFNFNPPGQPVPIPVTAQCETIHLEWGRSTATGSNPTAPYTLQIYTSTFVVPFLVDAGNDLSFDWAVPFTPGTLFQICMFDKNGVTGGCQAIYTVIQNTTDITPACDNVTVPDALDIVGTVINGPMSRYGWVDQCTDISIKPLNGTPPYTLTVAPSLHPPYNITSKSMDAMNWTVSLSWASPYFISVVDAMGNVWANGPMHSGIGSTSCLDTDASSTRRINTATVGAGLGGSLGGLLFGLIVAFLLARYQIRRRERERGRTVDEKLISEIVAVARDIEHQPGRLVDSTNGSSGWISRNTSAKPSLAGSGRTMDSISETVDPPTRSSSLQASRDQDLPSIPGPSLTTVPSQRQVYVVHHDGGGAPVTVYTEGEAADVVELPPVYAEGSQRIAAERARQRDRKGRMRPS